MTFYSYRDDLQNNLSFATLSKLRESMHFLLFRFDSLLNLIYYKILRALFSLKLMFIKMRGRKVKKNLNLSLKLFQRSRNI
jgi:hypothetical protein